MSNEKYHFLGIGGAGMSALARVLAARGARVSGSDIADSPTRRALEIELGIAIPIGHRAENLDGATVAVVSNAIKDDNPELIAARERGLEIVGRSEILGRVMDLFETRIAIGGTHGKTTTSAMVATVLEHAGLDPTALIGGDVPQWHSNARAGAGFGPFVAEACEAYGSFLDLRPTISVVTNVEADHLDYYKTLSAIERAFEVFVAKTTRLVVLCADDPGAARLAPAAACPAVTYGLDPPMGSLRSERGDLWAQPDPGGGYTVFMAGRQLGGLRLIVPGRHNVLNALAAAAVGLEVGIDWPVIAKGLAAFTGTGRRFEKLGETADGVTLVDDYAHHPTEIRATLAAARTVFPGRRIVAVFQPHLPSRTRDLLAEFAVSFRDADLIVLTDIYLAREAADPNLSGEHLAQEVAVQAGQGRVRYVADKARLPERLAEWARAGDVILTLGAGDIRAAGEGYLASVGIA